MTESAARDALRRWTTSNRNRPPPVPSSPHPMSSAWPWPPISRASKGQSRIHTGSDLRGYLEWCDSRGMDPARRHPTAHRDLHPLVARSAPVPTIHGVTPHVSGRWLLPNMRHRRRARALPGRVRPAAERARGITDARTDPAPVRSAVEHRQALDQPLRLRARDHARPAGAAHLRGPPAATSRTSARSTATVCFGSPARATKWCESRSRLPWAVSWVDSGGAQPPAPLSPGRQLAAIEDSPGACAQVGGMSASSWMS